MRHVETSQQIFKFILAIVIIIGAIGLWRDNTAPKSKAEIQAECIRTAGELYDTERNLIATRNPDRSTHEYYYNLSADAYGRDLEACRR